MMNLPIRRIGVLIKPQQPDFYVGRGVIYLRKIRLFRAAKDFYRAFRLL